MYLRLLCPIKMLFTILGLSALAAGAATQSVVPSAELFGDVPQTTDIADFLRVGYARPATTDWEGQSAYIVSDLSGVHQVYRLDSSGWPNQLTFFEDGIDRYSDGAPYFILNWGGNMAIGGASVGGSEQSQLYLIDCSTGRSRALTNNPQVRYYETLWTKDDRSIIYSSNEENGRDLQIHRMDVATGRSAKIFGDTAELAGSKYPVGFSQDGRRLIISRWNSNADMDLFLLDLDSGSYQPLTSDTTDVRYNYPHLMPDNVTILLTCNDNPDGIRRLAKMKVGSPEVEYINDGWIDPGWEIERLNISRDYHLMSVVVNQDGYRRLLIREVESRRELPSPPLDGIISGGTFDENGACLIGFESATRTADVYRWNPYTEDLQQLTFSAYAGLDRNRFVEPELVHYTSFDSLEIPAFLYLPPDYVPGQPVPFVLYAHGGPSNQFKPSFVRTFQYLTSHGYGILAPNPRGSSGYGAEYMALDDYKLRKNSLRDYKAAADWLISNGYTTKAQLGIRGGSYGGYVVLAMITEYPDLFSAAFCSVGIANFETFLSNTKAYRRKNREAEYGPLSDPEFLKEISPIHKADRIKTPLLVVHGANDTRVPVSEARQIIQSVAANGGVVDSLIFPDEGHVTAKLSNRIAEYRKMVEFFDTYLKAKTPPGKPEGE